MQIAHESCAERGLRLQARAGDEMSAERYLPRTRCCGRDFDFYDITEMKVKSFRNHWYLECPICGGEALLFLKLRHDFKLAPVPL